MKKLLNKIALMLTLIITLSFPTAFAETKNNLSNQNEVTPSYLPQYTTAWEVTSSYYVYSKFGDWRTGPTGDGPGNLSINESTTLNRSFTASISSGTVMVGNSEIGAQLGVTIGKAVNHGTSYSVPIGAGEKKTIIFRPKVSVHNVVQQKIQTNNYTGERKVLETKSVGVDKFNSWDYSWRYGY